jgi:hypothetical protein
MLVAAVEKNSEFVRLYSLVGMTEANTAEWHPVPRHVQFPRGSGRAGGGSRGQQRRPLARRRQTASCTRAVLRPRPLHTEVQCHALVCFAGAEPRAIRCLPDSTQTGDSAPHLWNPASARCSSPVRRPVKTRLNRLAPVS